MLQECEQRDEFWLSGSGEDLIEGEVLTELSLEMFGGGEVGGERESSISERGNCVSKGSEPSGEGQLVLFG